MKKLVKYIVMIGLAAASMGGLAACVPSRGAIYEDGEWDQHDAIDDIMMMNSEIDLDDAYHD